MTIAVITRAGLDKIWKQSSDGVDFKITHVGVGVGKYLPNSLQSSLRQEVGRWPIIDAEQVSQSQVVIYAQVNEEGQNASMLDGNGGYFVNEIGYYLSDGTLFAVQAQGENDPPRAYKSQNTPIEIDLQLKFDSNPLPDGKIIIENTGIRFNPGMKEAIEASTSALSGMNEQMANMLTAISNNALATLNNQKRMTQMEAS